VAVTGITVRLKGLLERFGSLGSPWQPVGLITFYSQQMQTNDNVEKDTDRQTVCFFFSRRLIS